MTSKNILDSNKILEHLYDKWSSMSIHFDRKLHSGVLVTLKVRLKNCDISGQEIIIEDSINSLDELFHLVRELIGRTCE